MRFTADEVERLLRLASTPAGGRTMREQIDESLSALQPLVPHACADAFLLEPARERGEPLYVASLPEKDLRDYVDHYRHHDPMSRFIVDGANRVVTLSDAASARELGRTEYSDLLGRLRITSIAGWSHAIGDGRYIAFGLQRRGRVPDFDGKERTVLGLVAPIVIRSIEEHLRPTAPLARLTRRERAVVELAVRGLPDRRIAAELGVGFATVRTHLQNAFSKVHVSNRTELLSLLASTGREKR